jgi:hypothetical protein
MMCTAALCACGRCGTPGRGDALAAIERISTRTLAEIARNNARLQRREATGQPQAEQPLTNEEKAWTANEA